MSELSYMVRNSWSGPSVEGNSTTVRNWLGDSPVFAVPDAHKAAGDRSIDRATATSIDPGSPYPPIVSISDLDGIAAGAIVRPLAVLHPLAEGDLEVLRRFVGAGHATRLFVMVWHHLDPVRAWLDGHGAVDLSTGVAAPAVDPMLVEAASMMVDEEYNGLSSGRGKDAVVQLVRAFTHAGYPLEVSTWLPAFFAAGGSFDHAVELAKLVTEMKAGTKHRVELAYRPEILGIIRGRVTSSSD